MADEGLSRHFYEKNHLGLKCRGGRKHGARCDGVKTASTEWKRSRQQSVKVLTDRVIVSSVTTADNRRPDCFSDTGTNTTELSTNRSAVISLINTLQFRFWLFSTSKVIWRPISPPNPLGGTPQEKLGRRADSTTRCVRGAKIITTRPRANHGVSNVKDLNFMSQHSGA